MHRELRKHLSDAKGVSDLVVVVFLDVRGFSSFAGMAESSEAALFLRSMYIKILDEYFPDAAFFKPTGDGLMIIRHIERDTLEEVVNDSIRKSLGLVQEFGAIAADDPMVNFDVPEALGVGIARGAATGLVSGEHTLDYSGRPLNLAARLMDLARPTGVVFDARVIQGLKLAVDLADAFTPEQVFVKGIADLSSIDIFRSEDVSIRSANRRPLVGVPFVQGLEDIAFSQFSLISRFIHRLDRQPVDPDSVKLEYGYPAVDPSGRKMRNGMHRYASIDPAEVRRVPEGVEIIFDYRPSMQSMQEVGVKPTWTILRSLKYTVADDVTTDADSNGGIVAAEIVPERVRDDEAAEHA